MPKMDGNGSVRLEGVELLGFVRPEQRSATAKVGKPTPELPPERSAKAKVGKDEI